MSFYEELKRRNVAKVAVLYIVASWLILQIADVGVSLLGLPMWIGKAVFLLLALGFPLALIFSWVFEMTPHGIRREKDIDHSLSRTGETGRKINGVIVVLLVLAIVGLIADRLIPETAVLPTSEIQQDIGTGERDGPDPSEQVAVLERSIAVLPFENMSRDEANEPFTVGIHDDILTQISRIASLKVISRTSVMQYRDPGAARNLREIGKELGVATVLEGGVQRVGDRLRINVQLIDTRTDVHLWAETYDRQLTASNIFAIQSEIAMAISQALRATLTSDEQQRLAYVPTENTAALETYFLGKQLLEKRTLSALSAAVEYFEQVVELDPQFALAYSGLADAYMLLPEYSATIDRDLVREKSEVAARRAITLNPDLPEVLTSMGWNRLIHDYDWDEAEALLSRAVEIEPNNTGALHWLSHVLSWQGRHDEALHWARQAVDVDPSSSLMSMNLSYILMEAENYEAAIRLAQETLRRTTTQGSQLRNLFLTYLRAGQPEGAAQALRDWAAATGRDGAAATEIGELLIRHHQSGKPVNLSDELVERLDIGSEDLAQFYAFAGDAERTLAALNEAYHERSGSRSVLSMKLNSGYDFIRDDPRFIELMRKVGLQI